MDKKYEFVSGDTKCFAGETLKRIRALRDIPGVVVKGDLGGYIRATKNLSHEGNCWVGKDACVAGEAVVFDNAIVTDHSEVYGFADVRNNAVICGEAKVFERAMVFGNATVFGNAQVSGDALVYHFAMVGRAIASDHAVFGGDICVTGFSFINLEMVSNTQRVVAPSC